MSTNDLVSAASSLLTGPLNLLFVVLLTLEWRLPKRAMRLAIAVFLLLLTAGGAAYFAAFGVDGRTKLQIALFTIAAIVAFNLAFARYPLLQMLSAYTSACIFTFICDTVCGVLVPGPGLAHVLAKLAVFLAAALLVFLLLRRTLLEVQREVRRKNWLWLMAIPLAMCFVFFYVIQMQGPLYADPQFHPVVLALCFCALCVYFSLYFILRGLLRQFRLQSEAEVLKVHLSSLRKHAETMRSMSDQLYVFQHDLRHYIRIQSVCLDNGDLAGMRDAIGSLSRRVEASLDSRSLRQYTGQALIDAVLSYYAGRCEAAGVLFHVRLELPCELGDTSELAVALSNALENAGEACLGMDPEAQREIRVTGGVENRQFALGISNTCGEKVRFDSRGYPAAQRAGHGYGTQSIVAYAEKNHAQLHYRVQDGWFSLRLLMPLPKAAEPVSP